MEKLNVVEEVTSESLPEGSRLFKVTVQVDWSKETLRFLLDLCPGSQVYNPRVPDIFDFITCNECIHEDGEMLYSDKRGETRETVYLLLPRKEKFSDSTYDVVSKSDAWAKAAGYSKSRKRIPFAVIGNVPDILNQFENLGMSHVVRVVSSRSVFLGLMNLPYPEAYISKWGNKRRGGPAPLAQRLARCADRLHEEVGVSLIPAPP